MKKVKIIANNPLDSNCSNISNFIGCTYKVVNELKNGKLEIDFGFDILTVYPGEYEIIE